MHVNAVCSGRIAVHISYKGKRGTVRANVDACISTIFLDFLDNKKLIPEEDDGCFHAQGHLPRIHKVPNVHVKIRDLWRSMCEHRGGTAMILQFRARRRTPRAKCEVCGQELYSAMAECHKCLDSEEFGL